MAPLYDLMLMLDPAAPDDARNKVRRDVESAIQGGGGAIEGTHDWGARAMAYEIHHKRDAEYHLLQFAASPPVLEQLDRFLRIDDAVLRHRIIKVKPGTPPPPSSRPSAAPEPAPDAV